VKHAFDVAHYEAAVRRPQEKSAAEPGAAAGLAHRLRLGNAPAGIEPALHGWERLTG